MTVIDDQVFAALVDSAGADFMPELIDSFLEDAPQGLAALLRLLADNVGELVADDIGRIAAAAHETVRQAGLDPSRIDALFFTGGSTGLKGLTDALSAAFPTARPVHGDRLASVAAGLGVYARLLRA